MPWIRFNSIYYVKAHKKHNKPPGAVEIDWKKMSLAINQQTYGFWKQVPCGTAEGAGLSFTMEVQTDYEATNEYCRKIAHLLCKKKNILFIYHVPVWKHFFSGKLLESELWGRSSVLFSLFYKKKIHAWALFVLLASNWEKYGHCTNLTTSKQVTLTTKE